MTSYTDVIEACARVIMSCKRGEPASQALVSYGPLLFGEIISRNVPPLPDKSRKRYLLLASKAQVSVVCVGEEGDRRS